jgi:hypothetical protein
VAELTKLTAAVFVALEMMEYVPAAANAGGFTLSVVARVAPGLGLSVATPIAAVQPVGAVTLSLKLEDAHPVSLLVTETVYVRGTFGPPCCCTGDTVSVGAFRTQGIGTWYVAEAEPTNVVATAFVARDTTL